MSRYQRSEKGIRMKNYWKRSLYYFRFGPVFFLKYLKGYRFYIKKSNEKHLLQQTIEKGWEF
ncbi:TPA_asm: hypothetical protein GG761_14895 [Listeria monocytogenes]|nr:hypothetical protein [Listeria monocytogenes]